jgi:hypothetical protein
VALTRCLACSVGAILGRPECRRPNDASSRVTVNESHQDQAIPARSGTLLLIVGVGRSGTSLLTGILGKLGVRIPQPEVQADETNPRGFGEPRWVVAYHRALLRGLGVTVNDARPAAWDLTAQGADTTELRAWLTHELEGADVVAVKDPRTVWFLPLWSRALGEIGVQPRFVTMLRHPAEIVRSAQRAYGSWQTDAGRTAGCLNVMLEAEHGTRSLPRAFALYDDLMTDWHREIRRIGEALDVSMLASAEHAAPVDAIVDPTLHRNRARWEGLDVPDALRELAERTWEQLRLLAEADTDETRAALDETRAAYRQLYAQAEHIAQSSIVAAAARNGLRGGISWRTRLSRRIPDGVRRRLRAASRRTRRPA